MVLRKGGCLKWEFTKDLNVDEHQIVLANSDAVVKDLVRLSLKRGHWGSEIHVLFDYEHSVGIEKISKVPKQEYRREMYDFEVRDSACFFAEGLVSHNSGQELRLPAVFSKEPVFINAFLQGRDVHQDVADRMGIPRDDAKTLNFAVLYGASGYTLYRNLGISQEKADKYIKDWWASLPALARWAKQVRRDAQKCGYVSNFFGRKRPLAYWYKSGSKKYISFANRSALNHKIQSTAGDLMRICLIKFHERFVKKGLKGFHLLSSIHDEINMAIHKDIVAGLLPEVIRTMEFQAPGWPIKLTVGVEIGWSWNSGYKFKFENNFFVPDVE